MKELVGKTIKAMYVNEDQSLLKFETDHGDIVYFAEGDCCSESWFADIVFDYGFFNGVVREVTELEIPEWLSRVVSNDKRTRQEYDEVYGFRVVTKEDHPFAAFFKSCDIIFRNSSNGYYGGWCKLLDQESEWGTRLLQNSTWEQITEDWRA